MPMNNRRPIRVLVADDELAVREAYRRILCDPVASTDRSLRQELRARLFHAPDSAAVPQDGAPPMATFDVTFCDGAEAAAGAVQKALTRQEPFAVAFLDMRMPPGRDGVWAAENIRRLDPEIEIVVSTAYSDVDPATISSRVPPQDKLFYLQKPFHPHEVRQMAIALGQRWCAERRITRLAFFDALTGLPNRTYFHEQLSVAIETAREQGQLLGVLYLDLDNFKRINDTLGHGVGDELLCRMSERLSHVLRREDIVGRPTAPKSSGAQIARLGGDEFVVLLHNLSDAGEAGAVAERVRHALMQPLELSTHQLLVTPSVGIALYPANGSDPETLFRNADLAMYFAKRQGPGQVSFFNETMSADGLMRLTLEARLRVALASGEFSLHYQPQFDLATGTISGLEALLRWSNPELGSVPPADFIPIAEATGLILPIGEWVLRSACRQAKAWHDEGLLDARVSVNVSGMQFAQRDFPALVAATLKDTGLPPESLELEITESLVMRDEPWTKQVISELKRTGVSLAIDDFGTGYSSLSRLREFAVDHLKIDRSFVRELQTSTESQALVAAMIKMAQTLGLNVIAEGVEDLSQLLHLQDEKCNQAQGFLLSRPLPVSEARALLQRLKESKEMTRTSRLRSLMK